MKLTSFINHCNLFIRSLIFSMVMCTAVFIYSFICILCAFFSLTIRYKVVTHFNHFIIKALKRICHVNYEIAGLENIPTNRAGIIMCKHQSIWETLLLPILFSKAAIILKRELLWVPFFGWGLATIKPIAINRNAKSAAMEQVIAQGKKCLAEKRFIIVFPEGTRIPAGKIGHYRLGGAKLALAANAPIIPIAHNAGYFWSKRTFLKRPGTIKVVIGPIIEPNNKTAETITSEVKKWIESTVMQLSP